MRPTCTRAFGRNRDDEDTLAVNNCKFLGTPMTYDWLISTLENIIFGTVMIVPILKPRKPDRSSPIDIGMAAKADHDETKYDEDQRLADIEVQTVHKGAGHMDSWSVGKGRDWTWNTDGKRMAKGGKYAHRGGKNCCSKDGREGARAQRERRQRAEGRLRSWLVRDAAQVDVAAQARVPWQQSCGMDPTSPCSSGLQADFCEEDASRDADYDRGDGGSVVFDPGSVSEMSLLEKSCVLVPFLKDVLRLCFWLERLVWRARRQQQSCTRTNLLPRVWALSLARRIWSSWNVVNVWRNSSRVHHLLRLQENDRRKRPSDEYEERGVATTKTCWPLR